MLKGKNITLRTIRESDLDFLYAAHVDIDNRGTFYPLGVMSEPKFRHEFNETGFWQKDEGMLVIVIGDEQIIGHIEFFPTASYLDEYEIAYHLYSAEHRGQGVITEALTLLSDYLFKTKRRNRLRLMIHPDNIASQKVAQKSGYQYESTARGTWYNRGKINDMEVYALLREEHFSR